MTNKSALELFRQGLDYIQISEALKITVPEVERKIHALRSAEKGDTSQQEYRDRLHAEQEHRFELKRQHVARMAGRREPLAYVGKEWGKQF
jgi:DnaJ-domain-containing protein 1